MVTSLDGQKSLSSGRVIILTNKQFSTRYGMILNKKSQLSSQDSKHGKRTYTVLITCDENEIIWNEEPNISENSELVVEPYTDSIEIYCPERPCAHTIVEIQEDEIITITKEVKSNLNTEVMINDFKKRQQPRFR